MELDAMFRFSRKLCTPDALEGLKASLTFKQKSGESFGFGEGATISLYREVADWVEIPRRYVMDNPTLCGDHVYVDRSVEGHASKFNFTKPLRPTQVPLVTDFLSKLGKDKARFGGIFSAPCGTGKTVMAYKFMAELGRPALILVHSGALMKQWREAAAKFTDLKPHEVGVIQQDTCEWRGMKVVIAMIESLISRKYDPAMYGYFGVVVADEVHRHAAAAWHRALLQFPARLRIGLSATPRRWDGLWDVIRWHIGEILTKGGEWAMKPKVFCINTGIALPPYLYSMRGGKINLSKLITSLTQIEYRNQMIVEEMCKAVKAARRVLVLSDRLEHLATLQRMFTEKWQTDNPVPQEELAKRTLIGDFDPSGVKIGRYVGGITDAQINYNQTCNLLFGTMQYAKEGLDDPSVDTLFLTVPKGDVEQPVGRVLRQAAEKKEPFVIDFVDNKTGPCIGFARSRRNQYSRLGFDVTEIDRQPTAANTP